MHPQHRLAIGLRSGLALAVSAVMAASTTPLAAGQVLPSTPAAPTSQSPSAAPPVDRSPTDAPAGTGEDRPMPLTVKLDQPVPAASIPELRSIGTVVEARYDVDGAAGGVFVSDSMSGSDIQEELDKATVPHGFQPPISSVTIELPAPPRGQDPSPQTKALMAPDLSAQHQQLAEEVLEASRSLPQAEQKGEPVQPDMGARPEENQSTRGAISPQVQPGPDWPSWSPDWINSTAWEFEPGVATIRHDLVWDEDGETINSIPGAYGLEIGNKLNNASIPYSPPFNRRPYCTYSRSDHEFWARRVSGNQVHSWGVLIYGQTAEQIDAYWDHNDSNDSCNDMEFSIGIGSPYKVFDSPSNPLLHVYTEIRAPRGTMAWSDTDSTLQTPEDNCSALGLPKGTHCMGLDQENSYGSAQFLFVNTGKSFPGSWHWKSTDGVADYAQDKCSTYGKIREAYVGRLGGISGPLKACQTWEFDTGSFGKAQNFDQGRIYWHSTVDNGTAHGVWGQIGERYVSLQAEAGPLGYPTTDELPCPSRANCAFNRFQNGNIYWGGAIGAHGIWGAIFTAYGQNGYENGRFGLPTSSEFDTPDGKQVNFERGWIRWIRATGAVITS